MCPCGASTFFRADVWSPQDAIAPFRVVWNKMTLPTPVYNFGNRATSSTAKAVVFCLHSSNHMFWVTLQELALLADAAWPIRWAKHKWSSSIKFTIKKTLTKKDMRDDEGLIFLYSSGVSIPKYSLDFWFIKICTDSHLAGVALEALSTEVTGNLFFTTCSNWNCLSWSKTRHNYTIL